VTEILSAAAVIWRRAPDPEVFLARRVSRMRLFGNVWSFCGGRVDPVDRQTAHPLRSAVIREMIEELGIELWAGGGPADPGLRRDLLEDPAVWADRCELARLERLPEPSLRLVTPEFYPRRFDTWFFVVEVEADCSPDLLESELDVAGWDTPERWVRRWQKGEFHLAPPALLMLRVLAQNDAEVWPMVLRREQQDIERRDRIQEIRLDPAIRLIPLRTPTLPPARHTNGYLVGDSRAWLVDPATPWPDGQAVLAQTLEASGVELSGVLLTHDHPDHTGAAEFVADRFRVPIAAHAITRDRLEGRVRVDREIQDGERLPFAHADGVPGALVAVFTPGHARGHLCFHEPRYGGLLAGDMVSTLSSILVDPDDGDMSDYMASLGRLERLPIQTVYPAHGPPDSRGTDIIREQIAHRREREAAVLAAAVAGPMELDALTMRVWNDVPRPMLGYAIKSAISILRMLADAGTVAFDGTRAGPPDR
jgi:glyoxylase-like metal-dependent hydrolase (beta-lactamase superfamily II)/8-oxo-dGTP pyrophosphatase MutT (NUDIX family)